MAYVGGLRDRLIRESVYQMIRSSLAALGWFAAGRQHKPVQFLADPVEHEQTVPFNTAALGDFDQTESEEEVGSLFSEHRWVFYVDFYGEDNPVAVHFSHDIKAILGGRMPSIGRSGPICDVYDYTQATPSKLFTVEIENIVIDRARNFTKPHQQHWYAVTFDVVDHYGDEVY